MPLNQSLKVFTDGEIVEKIYIIRGMKVMLDKDLAEKNLLVKEEKPGQPVGFKVPSKK